MIEEDIPDIVATLRECAEDSRKVEGDYYADQFATDASVFDDAADAIEKLRDEIAALREVITRAASHWLNLHPGVAWEGDLADAMAAAVIEIARLRLTDAEREAIAVAMHRCEGGVFRTLRALLERLG